MTSERLSHRCRDALIRGFFAESFGFNAVNWMAAVAVGLSVLVLRGRVNCKPGNDERPEAADAGAK